MARTSSFDVAIAKIDGEIERLKGIRDYLISTQEQDAPKPKRTKKAKAAKATGEPAKASGF